MIKTKEFLIPQANKKLFMIDIWPIKMFTYLPSYIFFCEKYMANKNELINFKKKKSCIHTNKNKHWKRFSFIFHVGGGAGVWDETLALQIKSSR